MLVAVPDRTAMCANFTDDDEGKDVVNAEGEKIGVVTEVSGGNLHVEPDPGITDTIKSTLGWGDADDATHRLDENHVEEVTDDEIRVQRM